MANLSGLLSWRHRFFRRAGPIIIGSLLASLAGLGAASANMTDQARDVTFVRGPNESRFSLTANIFCAEAQIVVADSRVQATNIVYTSRTEFVLSKPQVQPLITRQYVTYDEDADGLYPKMVACKLKTADHINTEYGAGSAGPEQTCRELQLAVLNQVYAGIPGYERQLIAFNQNTEVIVEPDRVMPTGEKWLEAFTPVWLDDDGRLRLQARALRVDWTDPQFATVPERFRGNHYCRLAAPEYLYRLITGKVNLRPASGPWR